MRRSKPSAFLPPGFVEAAPLPNLDRVFVRPAAIGLSHHLCVVHRTASGRELYLAAYVSTVRDLRFAVHGLVAREWVDPGIEHESGWIKSSRDASWWARLAERGIAHLADLEGRDGAELLARTEHARREADRLAEAITRAPTNRALSASAMEAASAWARPSFLAAGADVLERVSVAIARTGEIWPAPRENLSRETLEGGKGDAGRTWILCLTADRLVARGWDG